MWRRWGWSVPAPPTSQSPSTPRVLNTDGLGNPPWGTADTASFTFDTGGLMVLALPASTEVGIYEGDGINQTWSGSSVLDLNLCERCGC